MTDVIPVNSRFGNSWERSKKVSEYQSVYQWEIYQKIVAEILFGKELSSTGTNMSSRHMIKNIDCFMLYYVELILENLVAVGDSLSAPFSL